MGCRYVNVKGWCGVCLDRRGAAATVFVICIAIALYRNDLRNAWIDTRHMKATSGCLACKMHGRGGGGHAKEVYRSRQLLDTHACVSVIRGMYGCMGESIHRMRKNKREGDILHFVD